jgi:hypothetical protein
LLFIYEHREKWLRELKCKFVLAVPAFQGVTKML